MGTAVNDPGRAASGAHHHGQNESGIYILRGHVRFRWGEHLEHVVGHGPGDFIFVPPFEVHMEENLDTANEAELLLARNSQEAIVVNVPTRVSHDAGAVGGRLRRQGRGCGRRDARRRARHRCRARARKARPCMSLAGAAVRAAHRRWAGHETIEDTAELVTAAGGTGIAVRVDHSEERRGGWRWRSASRMSRADASTSS